MGILDTLTGESDQASPQMSLEDLQRASSPVVPASTKTGYAGLDLINNWSNQIAQEQAQKAKSQVVQQAIQQYKAGDPKSAYATLGMIMPEAFAKSVGEQVNASPIAYGKRHGTLQAESEFNSNPAQIHTMDNQNALNMANAKIKQNPAAQLSPFQKESQRTEGKIYGQVQSAGKQADEQLGLIDDAIKGLKSYIQKSPGGTGPLATLGGLTKYVSSDTQDLESKFRMINVKNMAQTFQGMSRAIDSNTERRAWEATQANLTNDDSVNAHILLGSKALAIKARAEAQAQKQYVENNKDGNLNGYESPVFGKTVVVVSPDGEMELVQKDKQKEAFKSGFSSLDDYANKQILRVKATSKSKGSPEKPTEIFASDEDAIKEAKRIKAKGSKDPEYDGAIRFLKKMGVE